MGSGVGKSKRERERARRSPRGAHERASERRRGTFGARNQRGNLRRGRKSASPSGSSVRHGAVFRMHVDFPPRVAAALCHVIPRASERHASHACERVRSPTPKYSDASAVDRQSMRDGEIERLVRVSEKYLAYTGILGRFYRITQEYRSLGKSVRED